MKTFNRARYTFIAGALFIFLLVILHFIKPELDPSWNFISEYEVGKFGWIMQIAFIALATSCVFMVIALWKKVKLVGKVGLVMLLISATGMTIAAIFKTDPFNTPRAFVTQSGNLHQLGAMLDNIPFAAILITIALLRKKEWKINRAFLIVALIFVWIAFIYFVASVQAQFPEDGIFGPTVRLGWQNRLMILTQAIWLMVVSNEVMRNTRSAKVVVIAPASIEFG